MTINKNTIDRLMQPLQDSIDADTKKKDTSVSTEERRHRHVMDWPELMESEGEPIRP